MRHGSDTASFDLSDTGDIPPMRLPIDRVEDALAVAHSVLRDYAPDGAACDDPSRLARLARFVIGRMHLDTPRVVRAGQVGTYDTDRLMMNQCGEITSIRWRGPRTKGAIDPGMCSLIVIQTEAMRELAALALRVVDDAE